MDVPFRFRNEIFGTKTVNFANPKLNSSIVVLKPFDYFMTDFCAY